MNRTYSNSDSGFLARYKWVAVVFVITLLAISYFVFSETEPGETHSRPRANTTIVSIAPPPPPPQPPPPPPPPKNEKPEPPKDEEMVVQEKVADEPEPEETPAPEEPPPISTNLTGEGGMAGLAPYKSGQGIGTGTGAIGRSGGSKFGFFASQVQTSIVRAMQNHAKTKHAIFSVEARIWAEATGRIVRVTLATSTGDPTVDDALKNEVLNGLQLRQAPPADMPMPIVIRLRATDPTRVSTR